MQFKDKIRETSPLAPFNPAATAIFDDLCCCPAVLWAAYTRWQAIPHVSGSPPNSTALQAGQHCITQTPSSAAASLEGVEPVSNISASSSVSSCIGAPQATAAMCPPAAAAAAQAVYQATPTWPTQQQMPQPICWQLQQAWPVLPRTLASLQLVQQPWRPCMQPLACRGLLSSQQQQWPSRRCCSQSALNRPRSCAPTWCCGRRPTISKSIRMHACSGSSNSNSSRSSRSNSSHSRKSNSSRNSSHSNSRRHRQQALARVRWMLQRRRCSSCSTGSNAWRCSTTCGASVGCPTRPGCLSTAACRYVTGWLAGRCQSRCQSRMQAVPFSSS